MDNQTFQRIKDLITQHQAIGVVVKPNPSLDEMAGGLGMYLVLGKMGKQASIACPTDVVVGLSNLVGIQKVSKSLGSSSGKGGNLTVSFPYQEGEIEKVSYTQENGLLNILVQAGQNGLSFSQNDVKFSQPGGSGAMPTLLFAIGVPSLLEVSSLVPQDALQNMTVVNIDNKPENAKYGDVVVVSPRFSSVSEQVADFLTLLEPQIELDRDASQNLFDGISFATKDYTAQNTSYLAFEMAGILMKKGATRYKTPGASVPQGQSANQYFPPQPASNAANAQQFMQQPVQQPVMQPVQPPMPQPQPMPQPFNNVPAQQPVMQPQFNQPQPMVQPMPQPQPVQQPIAQQDQAPADWLAPKVYKGSSVL